MRSGRGAEDPSFPRGLPLATASPCPGSRRDEMRCLLRLLRSARWLMVIALCASAVGGLSKAALVAVLNQALGAPEASLTRLGYLFLLFAALIVLTHTLSEIFFVRLGQNARA